MNMGIEMRICQLVGLILALIFLGCESKKTGPAATATAPPKPTIKVELNEVGQAKVRFPDHVQRIFRDSGRYNNYYDYVAVIELSSLKDLRAYKKQVDFLMKQLEEAEKQMEIHELQLDGKPRTAR